MAYTVKQLAAMSGVSVRTLHFYDETGLLKPAYHRANGYRFYEEAQLLTLQQILFYRELGFELKQIKRILGRADFEKVAALGLTPEGKTLGRILDSLTGGNYEPGNVFWMTPAEQNLARKNNHALRK